MKEEKKGIEGFGLPAKNSSEELSSEQLKKKEKKFKNKIKKIDARASLITSVILALVIAALLLLQNVLITSVMNGNENFLIDIFNVFLGVVGGTIIISIGLFFFFVVSLIGIINRRNWLGAIIFIIQLAAGAVAILVLVSNLSIN